MARRPRGTHGATKLALIRQLQRQHVQRVLPLGERRLEQSFNEQFFTRVLDYQTLLSHDREPFNLLPQNYAGGRYDDFSLGFFGAGQRLVRACAELKGPDVDLDAAQGGNYGGITPVEQCFRVARNHAPDCRWVLVSNFRELRLYAVDDAKQSLAVAHLDRVQTLDDVADLCVHFGRRALLETSGEADMTAATDPIHPRHGLTPNASRRTITYRFVPSEEHPVPLFALEEAFANALTILGSLGPGGADAELFLGRDPYTREFDLSRDLRDGWLVLHRVHEKPVGLEVKLAVSRFCEVQLTLAQPRDYGTIERAVEMTGIFFGNLLEAMSGQLEPDGRSSPVRRGHVGAELFGVKNELFEATDAYRVAHRPVNARSPFDEIEVSELPWSPRQERFPEVIASVICELAANFRDQRGGVALNRRAVITELASRRVLGDTHP